jgi:hypothetical protein
LASGEVALLLLLLQLLLRVWLLARMPMPIPRFLLLPQP